MTTLDLEPAGPAWPPDVAELIRQVNETNEAAEDLCLRARQATDSAASSRRVVDLSEAAARSAKIAHQTVQAEYPARRASLPRQLTYALGTVMLDGVACYFAAQALDGSQDATLVWAGLFLAVLAGGEVALDYYRDRQRRPWRVVVTVLTLFMAMLGVLRFWYLATIGAAGGLIPATAGAALFTAATAGFVFLGYRALRSAETPHAWRARQTALAARRAARSAKAAAERDVAERDRLISAYVGQVRRLVLRTCTAEQQIAMESAVRDHLLGKPQA
jgi:hypothetical protein